MPPEAIDRREAFLMEKFFVPSCGHGHEHTFQGHALAINLALGISVLPFDVVKEFDEGFIELGGGT